MYLQKFRCVWFLSTEGSRRNQSHVRWRAAKKKKKKKASWALLLSLLELITTFQQNYDNNRLVVMPNEVETKQPILPWLATQLPAPSFVWFVPSTRIFQASAVYMVLESSSCQDLPTSWQDPRARDKYNPLHVNWIQKTYDPPSRIFQVPGSFSFHLNSPIRI